MRALVLAWLAAGSLLAQFQDLATPDDGSVLYFSSSLRLSGSTQFLFAKLFRMDATGIHLYAQQAPGASLGRTTENFYLLTAPDVSADGTVLAYTASRPCSGGSGCIPVEQHQGHIVGAGQTERVAAGYVRISRNGRYALYFGMTAIFPTPATQLIDLQSGAATTVPYMIRPSGARRRIAFDGTVLATSDDSLVLWRKSGTETLSNSHAAADAMVNDAATLVVYQSTGPGSKLIAYDVRSGAETVLAELSGDDPASFGATMTGDGSLVLFLNRGQVYLVHSDGSGLRRLSDDPAGIVEAILTGNGQFVYAVTGEGRMIRIGTGSGEVLELVSRTPNITSVEQAVPGTLVRVTGTALAAASAAGTSPLPDTLAGVGIKLGGVPMPLAQVTPTEILWQVPWEWPAGATPFQLLSGSSPFVTGPDSLQVEALAPRFYEGEGLELVAVHSGWDALVTADHPAQRGETIHLYMAGLGPVSPPAATGVSAPADPLARVVMPLHCQVWDGGPNDAQIWFAGLAPGMVGIYQVELQVPAGLRITPVTVICSHDSQEGVQAIGILPVNLAGH